MNCQETLFQLSDYLDGDLDTDLIAEIKRHLSACEDCRVLVNTTEMTIQFFCNTEPINLPPDVERRLQQALAARLKAGAS